MKTFNYSIFKEAKWDNEILSSVAKINEFKGKQSNLNFLNKAKITKLMDNANIQSTIFSNKIEGIITTSTRIKQIYANKSQPKNRDECEILGYRDVLKTINENYEYIPLKSSYILQLHRDLFKYSYKQGGSFKNQQNYITETKADGSKFVRFTPLEPSATTDAMDNLCLEFNLATSSLDVEPLILIPVFIVDFLCIHPFNDGNGRISRLLTDLLLYKFGYFVGKYISIEKIIDETKEVYYQALFDSSFSWYENCNDYTPFIKYFLHILLKSHKTLMEQLLNLENEKLTAVEQVEKAISTIYGKFSKKNIIELCPLLSETSIERALKELITARKIKKYGDKKATYYTK